MRLIFLILTFFIGFFTVKGQTVSKLDSLIAELDKDHKDSVRANLMMDISIIYYNSDLDKSIEYGFKGLELTNLDNMSNAYVRGELTIALALLYQQKYDSSLVYFDSALLNARNHNLKKRESEALVFSGWALEANKLYDSALVHYKQSYDLAKEVDHKYIIVESAFSLGQLEIAQGMHHQAIEHLDEAYKYSMQQAETWDAWNALNMKGVAYDQLGQHAKAAEVYLEALKIAEETKDIEGQTTLAINLGVLYSDIENDEKSLEYYEKAMESAKISNDQYSEATLYNNIGLAKFEQGDTLGALKDLRKSIEICREIEYDYFQCYGLDGLGDILTQMGQYDSAEYYLNKALEMAIEHNVPNVVTTAYRDLGVLYMKTGNYAKSQQMLDKSRSESGLRSLIKEEVLAVEQLYQLNKTRGRSDMALAYYEEYKELQDSIFTAENQDKITQMMAEYDFKKEKQKLEFDQAANELELKQEIVRQEEGRKSMLIALALTALLIISLGRSYYLIQKQNKKLTQLNEEKNTLMGVVAHDLRSPLNNIKGLLHLLKEGSQLSKNDEQRMIYEMIDDSTDRMRGMIDKVLDINAIESMKVNLNLERTDLGKSLIKASNQFKQVASQKTISILNDISEEQHFANVDDNYLTQIFDNLLSNAIKFSENGKQIDLHIEAVNGHQTISVKDQGPGISEEDKTGLFKRFTKLSAKPTGDESSTGLGLSIVKKFVDAMEGEIWCESEPQKGTTFFVKFKSA